MIFDGSVFLLLGELAWHETSDGLVDELLKLLPAWTACSVLQEITTEKGVQQFFSSIANNFETFKVWLMVSYGFMRFDDIWLYQGVRFLVAWWVDRMVLKCLRFSHFHGYSKWKVSNLAHWVSTTVPGGNQKPLPGWMMGRHAWNHGEPEIPAKKKSCSLAGTCYTMWGPLDS